MHWPKVILLSLLAALSIKLIITLGRRKNSRNERLKCEPVLDVAPRRDDEIFTLTLLAKSGNFYSGYELLQALLAAGFRYGSMNIFHRHEKDDGTGEVLFSLAQATDPGSFDLSDVGAIKCSGLTLFMELNGKRNMAAAFNAMVDAAKQLADDLGGDIYDSNRRLLNQDDLEIWHTKYENL